MDNSHKKDFWMMINVMMELMNKPPLSKEAVIVWWHALKDYDFDVVRSAMDKWVDNETKAPAPAQIKELCKPEPQIYQALPHKKSHQHQAVMASNVAKFIRENLKPKERDWVAHWEGILMEPDKHQPHNVESAYRALKNLGRPWKGKPSQRKEA